MTGSPQAPARAGARIRALTLIGLLAVVTIAWAAIPARPGPFPRIALICAAVAGLASIAQLALGSGPASDALATSFPNRIIARLAATVQAMPWPELMTIAVLALEVQHSPRPWHTGLLGVALLGYLLAVHLAETQARAGVLRPQLPLIAAGIGIAALAAGAAALPALPDSSASAAVRVIAATPAVITGCLAVPVWLGRQRQR